MAFSPRLTSPKHRQLAQSPTKLSPRGRVPGAKTSSDAMGAALGTVALPPEPSPRRLRASPKASDSGAAGASSTEGASGPKFGRRSTSPRTQSSGILPSAPEAISKPIRRVYHDQEFKESKEYERPVGKKVSAIPNSSSVEFLLGSDVTELCSTSKYELERVLKTSPRPDGPVSARRSLVKVQQPVGGSTKITLGTDKVTYFESSKEDALKSARSYALADAARKQVVAGVVPREESRRISRGVPPPTTISLSESRELLEVSSATRRELEAAVRPEAWEAAAKAPFAGTRPNHRESIKVEAPPGGPSHYKFDYPEPVAVGSNYKNSPPRKPQPVGGLGGADPSVIAGNPTDVLGKHRAIKVTQSPGGDSSIRLG